MFYVIFYCMAFVVPKPIAFSYAEQTCVTHLTLFPSIMQQANGDGYNVSYKDTWRIGDAPIASLSTCFSPSIAPEQGRAVATLAPLGSWFGQQTFVIEVPTAPVASVAEIDGATVSVSRALEVPLTAPDTIFSYRVLANKQQGDCQNQAGTLQCDVQPLALDQGKKYTLTLARYFNNVQQGEVGQAEVTTLKALKIKSSSVKNEQVVYSKPKELKVVFDKELLSADVVLDRIVDGKSKPVTTEVVLEEKTLKVGLAEDLARTSTFKLRLKQVESVDGSVLADPVTYTFKTSGGPKVTSISIDSFGLAPSGSFTITFDQPVDNWGQLSEYLAVSGISSYASGSGKQITVTYSGGTCDGFSVTVKKGFVSKAGIAQTNDWRYDSRTRCYSTQSIGTSHQGRSIIAYSFGSGNRAFLFTGAIHGNEYSARSLMYTWIDEIDANIGRLPDNTRVVIIPEVNPDGVANGSRYNSRNVDLNRNFPTSDWQKDVQTVYGDPFPNGGGKSAGSEKETKALMAFSSALRPTLTMSYHAQAAYAIANTCGNSGSIAESYANQSGYRNMTGVGGAFSYSITGTYDDWLCEKQGLPSVLIEMMSSSYVDSWRHLPAMWSIVGA